METDVMKYKIFTAVIFVFLMVSYTQAAVPNFGDDGLKGLSESQIKDLSEGKIIFNTTDSVNNESAEAKSSIITAALLLDKPPEEIYNILYHTEDQIKYLEEIKEIKIVNKNEVQDNIEFKLKILMISLEYRVIHSFDKKNLYIHWTMDKNFKNDLESLQGFWKLYPYPGGRTLARYGSNVSVKHVPGWLENMFKKKGVEKSLNCVKKYVNTGWTLKK
jgi:hypothetical protein